MTENERPGRDRAPSVLALALRVLRGELTEVEAIEIVRRQRSSEPTVTDYSNRNRDS